MRIQLTLLVALVAAGMPSPAAAFGSDREVWPDALQTLELQSAGDLRVAQSDGMSLSQAIESIRRRTGGKVISAETRMQGNREVHHIKVLTKNGQVKTFKVNGRRR